MATAESAIPRELRGKIPFRGFVLGAALLFAAHGIAAQRVVRAYIGGDTKAHIVYADGDKTIAPEQDQVGAEDITVAPDQRTVGWKVLVDNCCTSYPIPIAVVVYRDGKKTVIADGLMVHAWHFVGGGKRIAVLSGHVHGNAVQAALYSSRTGKILATWNAKGAAPAWAKGWDEQR